MVYTHALRACGFAMWVRVPPQAHFTNKTHSSKFYNESDVPLVNR